MPNVSSAYPFVHRTSHRPASDFDQNVMMLRLTAASLGATALPGAVRSTTGHRAQGNRLWSLAGLPFTS